MFDQNPSDLKVFLDVGKIVLWCGALAAIYRVGAPIAKVVWNVYEDFKLQRAEHRMLMDDLWERHPEKKDDFYIAVGESRTLRSYFKKRHA